VPSLKAAGAFCSILGQREYLSKNSLDNILYFGYMCDMCRDIAFNYLGYYMCQKTALIITNKSFYPNPGHYLSAI
jgi:hypothetical protein